MHYESLIEGLRFLAFLASSPRGYPVKPVLPFLQRAES